MFMDFSIIDSNITTENDICDLVRKMNNVKNKKPFLDEVILNVKCINSLYDKLIVELKECFFGTNALLAQVNINIDNIEDMYILPNDIDKFVVPISCFDTSNDDIINDIKNLINACNKTYFTPIISIKINNCNEYKKAILIYDKIKAYFYDEEIKILYYFKDKDIELIKEVLKDTSYIKETVNFLGYSENSVLRVIKKCLREMEIGIEQIYENNDREIINTIDIKEIELENILNSSKNLVRNSMDDYFKL